MPLPGRKSQSQQQPGKPSKPAGGTIGSSATAATAAAPALTAVTATPLPSSPLPVKVATTPEPPSPSALASRGEALIVCDTTSLQAASDWLQSARDFRKRVNAFFKPAIDAAKASLDAAKKQLNDVLAAVDYAEHGVRSKILEYEADLRAAAEAERRRLEAEAEARMNAIREQEAKAAEAEGDRRAARVIRQAPLPPVVVDDKDLPVPSGISELKTGVHTKRWPTFEVTDPKAVPVNFLCPDEEAIQKYIDEWKAEHHDRLKDVGPDDLPSIPGIRCWWIQTVVSRSRK